MEEKRRRQQEEPLVAPVHRGGLTPEICVCLCVCVFSVHNPFLLQIEDIFHLISAKLYL